MKTFKYKNCVIEKVNKYYKNCFYTSEYRIFKENCYMTFFCTLKQAKEYIDKNFNKKEV